MFEKATKAVKEVSESVIDSARSLGNSIYSTSKEQGEIASLKAQKLVLEKKIQDFYAMIGERYCDYSRQAQPQESFDASDIVAQMQPEIDKLRDIKDSLLKKEISSKKLEEEKRQKKAQETYETDKAKLGKALELDIITQEEYDEKIVKVQKRFDNYEQLRKIDLQLQMGIIDQEEYKLKISKVLS